MKSRKKNSQNGSRSGILSFFFWLRRFVDVFWRLAVDDPFPRPPLKSCASKEREREREEEEGRFKKKLGKHPRLHYHYARSS